MASAPGSVTPPCDAHVTCPIRNAHQSLICRNSLPSPSSQARLSSQLRAKVATDIDEAGAKELALASPQVRKHIDNQAVQRVIYVPGKLANLVVR